MLLPLFINLILASCSASGQNAYLQYDDGSLGEYDSESMYRGVWFDVFDFMPGVGFQADFTEWWMYNPSSDPWDTSDFYAELWIGDSSGPSEFLNSTLVTAVHCGPSYVNYPPTGVYCWITFWAIENTILSSNGSPYLIGDPTPPSADHSFYSDDFVNWSPWSNGVNTGDYLVRCSGDWTGTGFECTTWGSIKSVF